MSLVFVCTFTATETEVENLKKKMKNKIENQDPLKRKLSLPGKSWWLENYWPNQIVIII